MSDAPVWNILNQNLFFVNNAMKAFEAKTSDKLDIYDPQTGACVLECREPDIGTLTKMARFFGGRHDRGTPFDLVVQEPDSGLQVLRATRGSASLTFYGPATAIANHDGEIVGSIKRKALSLGAKYNVSLKDDGSNFILEVKSKFLSGNRELFISGKKVAVLTARWKGDHADYYRKERFGYAISISPEVPADGRMRQILMAFAVAQ